MIRRFHDPVLAPLNVYENDVDAYIPEFWANESLALLQENMVAASLVHRDFEETLQQYGDVVNIRRPSTLRAVRKVDGDDVTVQDVSATNIQVTLDQHVHTSFLIYDGQESKSSTELIEEFLQPAIVAQARFVDQMVLGQHVQFLANSVGDLTNGLTSSTAIPHLLAFRKKMNDLKIPFDSRHAVLNSITETELLAEETFHEADKVGDGGIALREALLGRKFGIDFYASQNMAANLVADTTTSTGAINNAAGYPVGHAAAMTVDGITGAIAVGTWVNVGGAPYRVTASSATLGNTTSITLNRALTYAVADDAVIRFSTPGAVNNGAGYAAGWAKPIVIDGFTKAPQVGMAVSFGLSGTNAVYTVLEATTTSLLLDRPLEAALLDDAVVNVGVPGAYSFGFTKNAIALVIRPLVAPKSGAGALSTTVSANGLTMRVTITYNGTKQAHLVTLDFLAGIKVLDANLGAVLLG